MVKKPVPLMKRLKTVAPVRLIVSSFLLIVVLGTLLLMLPISSKNGCPTPVIDALFTSTSATCVTGLVVYDTWTHWSWFGQIVILALIQIGGLGLVTFATGINVLFRRKMGLRDLQIATQNTGSTALDVYRLIRIILFFTFTCELIGAGLLAVRFIPQFGSDGIWISLFLSISAYCNAGFDILGFQMENGSLIPYAGDPFVCLVIALLIIIGGIGFIVIKEIYFARISPLLHRKKPMHLTLHSSIVLSISALLLVAGTVLFLVCEYDHTLKDMNFGEKLNTAFFQSASSRTAGYASVDIGAERDITKLITCIFMFVGAAPTSTGGGVKITTFVVLVATVGSVVRGYGDTVLLKRRIDKNTVYRSLAIFTFSFLLVIITTSVILSSNPHMPISATDALFEAASAFGTVGLSTGITPFLSVASKCVVALTMFVGRVGPVSLMVALTMRSTHRGETVLPEGKIVVG